jgi:hypothetical protein
MPCVGEELILGRVRGPPHILRISQSSADPLPAVKLAFAWNIPLTGPGVSSLARRAGEHPCRQAQSTQTGECEDLL